MQGFALYRFPYASDCLWMTGEVRELGSYAELTGQQGFLVAPFASSTESPILLIGADEVSTGVPAVERFVTDLSIKATSIMGKSVFGSFQYDSFPLPSFQPQDTSRLREDYHIDFLNFYARLQSGDFQKLVLSRSQDIGLAETEHPFRLFLRACERYPRMFISLVYTPQSGMWLTATPEILLSGRGNQWQTIALAGTMAYGDDVRWSDKNIQEQRYVATYIIEQLERFTSNFTEEGPRTVRAGHLAHLRSDFRFTLPDRHSIGDLLQALHPTPAVCGLPKQHAFRFIRQNERRDRTYYSGFMGPLLIDDTTNLFVTLRCMRLFQNGYRLYAGGGLLTDSVEEQEWQETETKLDTMRNIIHHV